MKEWKGREMIPFSFGSSKGERQRGQRGVESEEKEKEKKRNKKKAGGKKRKKEKEIMI
jgi:hypothetical protein